MDEVGRSEALAYEFQSAPLTEARGDRPRSNSPQSSSKFQSAPLTEARGDGATDHLLPELPIVSIRSPDRSQGRFSATTCCCQRY